MMKTILDVEQLFGMVARVCKSDPVALAVSGGPDSMAMLHLFAHWRQNHPLKPGLKDLVLSVDHGLRAKAADEVAFVIETALQLGFEAMPIKLDGLQGKAGVQEKARAARYEAISAIVQNKAISILLTAHTKDDQAETFFMRLKRGSGVEGLACILPKRELYGVTLVRSLLEVRKQDLLDWLQERDLKWCDDPSNQDDGFERVKVRKLLGQLDEAGELSHGIAESARRLQGTREALEVWTESFFALEVICHLDGRLGVNKAAFLKLPHAMQTMVLQRALLTFGQGQVQLSKIERGVEHLVTMTENKSTSKARFALGGVMIEKTAHEELLFYRETGRDALEEIHLDPIGNHDSQVLWDHRVGLHFAAPIIQALSIRALNEQEIEQVQSFYQQQEQDCPLSRDVMSGLATIWQADKARQLLAIPQLAAKDECLFSQALSGKDFALNKIKVAALFPVHS